MKKEKFTIPAEFDHLALIRDFIERTGNKYSFSNRVINSLKLAVEEACTNIIRHGYKGMPPGKIVIKFIIRRFSFTVVLVDNGRSFDPRQVKPPDLKHYVEIGKVGGLGIMMIRKLMDEIDYRSDSRKNEFRMTKYRENIRGLKLYQHWKTIKLYTQKIQSKYALLFQIILALMLFSLATLICSSH